MSLCVFPDRTCKIWDLSSNEEILTLDGHPNNVVGVQYAEMTSLIHTVSAYVIKVWDPRRGNVCIKTLTLVQMIRCFCPVLFSTVTPVNVKVAGQVIITRTVQSCTVMGTKLAVIPQGWGNTEIPLYKSANLRHFRHFNFILPNSVALTEQYN